MRAFDLKRNLPNPRRLALALVAALAVLGAGCMSSVADLGTTAPTLTRHTSSHTELVSLPPARGKILVSVYNFRDQTGQYKPLPNVSSFSTAVTQGATSMLVQALKDSEWFVPVEREGLQNLLTERKMIRANETGKPNPGAVSLPPLDTAQVLLQGGITAYETNVATGGFGAKYFGLGGSVLYQQDQVTLHLRAVDIKTGRVLKSVSVTKTILSKALDAGIYRFLTFKRLLEIEGGFSTNEPAQLCVAAAVEKAVTALIVEGVVDRLWDLKNPKDREHPAIVSYLKEKESVQTTSMSVAEVLDSGAAPMERQPKQ